MMLESPQIAVETITTVSQIKIRNNRIAASHIVDVI